tara:strand:+ start:55 stop:285 length:231 start_codon:yes stop_codon:yes gene_type:complete
MGIKNLVGLAVKGFGKAFPQKKKGLDQADILMGAIGGGYGAALAELKENQKKPVQLRELKKSKRKFKKSKRRLKKD